MELFKKQFSLNSGEDMELAFHWSRHLLKNIRNCYSFHPVSDWMLEEQSQTLFAAYSSLFNKLPLNYIENKSAWQIRAELGSRIFLPYVSHTSAHVLNWDYF